MTAQKDRESGLAWHAPQLAGSDTLELASPDFGHGATIPAVYAAASAGGRNLSPALTWNSVPPATAQVLLLIEDPDAPTRTPFNHGIALLDPAVTGLARGALGAGSAGVRLLRSGRGPGYLGPAPPKSHGPHRYVFQVFALGTPLTAGPDDAALDSATLSTVVAAARDVLARGRLDGFYQRT